MILNIIIVFTIILYGSFIFSIVHKFVNNKITKRIFIKSVCFDENEYDWIIKNEIEVGSFVKICNNNDNEEITDNIGNLVGEVGKIIAINKNGIVVKILDVLNEQTHYFPYYCLKKI